jgi:hypothetical protein
MNTEDKQIRQYSMRLTESEYQMFEVVRKKYKNFKKLLINYIMYQYITILDDKVDKK